MWVPGSKFRSWCSHSKHSYQLLDQQSSGNHYAIEICWFQGKVWLRTWCPRQILYGGHLLCYHHLDSWVCLVQTSLFFLYYLLKQKQHHLCHLLTSVYLCLAFFGISHRPLRRRVQRLREPHRKPEQNFPDFVPRIKLAKNFTKNYFKRKTLRHCGHRNPPGLPPLPPISSLQSHNMCENTHMQIVKTVLSVRRKTRLNSAVYEGDWPGESAELNREKLP